MDKDFKEKGIEFMKEAVQEDESGNYEKAIDKYTAGLEYFTKHLKYEKNSLVREAIKEQFTEYLERALYLKDSLKNGVPEQAAPTSEGSIRSFKGSSKRKDSKEEDEEEKSRMQQSLSNTIMIEKPNVKWDDVAGLENAKEALKEATIMPNKFPQFFAGKCRPCSGILLYGPPGTGKSYLAKALAAEADSTHFRVSAIELVSKWAGENEKLVSDVFEMARKNTPAVVFLDDIDVLCNAQEGNESEPARRIKAQILIEMRALEDANESHVLVLGATNLPYMLDKTLIRRFDRRLYIPLPEAPVRRMMFKIHLGSTPNTLVDKDFEELGEMTVGFSGLDISAVVKDALIQSFRFARQATHFRQIPGDNSPNYMPCEQTAPGAMEMNLQYFEEYGLEDRVVPPPISMKGFERVLIRATPTVGQGDLAAFKRFTVEFGEEG